MLGIIDKPNSLSVLINIRAFLYLIIKYYSLKYGGVMNDGKDWATSSRL